MVSPRPADTSVVLDTEFKRGLGLFDSTMVVAGSMIGSGIYIVSAAMARELGSPGWLLVAWVITGVLTITAALAYGELAAMMPNRMGRVDDGALRRSQGLPLRAGNPRRRSAAASIARYLRHHRCSDSARGVLLLHLHRGLVPGVLSWHYLVVAAIGSTPQLPSSRQTRRRRVLHRFSQVRLRTASSPSNSSQTLVFWAVTFSLNIWLVYRGISRGIERFVSFAMPTMACLRAHRPRPRAHPRHARSRPARAERRQRARLHVESELRRRSATPRPGSRPRARSSSACRSDSASSSTTRRT